MAYAIISTSPNNATPISTSATVSVVNDSIKVQPLLISADSKVGSAFHAIFFFLAIKHRNYIADVSRIVPWKCTTLCRVMSVVPFEENNEKAMGKFLRGHMDTSRHISVYMLMF